jgi:hypothetical protein
MLSAIKYLHIVHLGFDALNNGGGGLCKRGWFLKSSKRGRSVMAFFQAIRMLKGRG